VVFFDGEEAFKKWSDTDSLYGSRHLAEKWGKEGVNARLKALINVDMIGDKNLVMLYDGYSAPTVKKIVWDAAGALGYTKEFPRADEAVEDDHIPFLKAGVRAVDLIDFKSQSTFWHTPQDTMDKLSPHSFEVVGAVVMRSIADLESQK
jgi:Zn-dependent M28 family amino/carboxypeptidase